MVGEEIVVDSTIRQARDGEKLLYRLPEPLLENFGTSARPAEQYSKAFTLVAGNHIR
jgi:hypothetical protein